ncbi:von Willebrand factor type A domain-containing protein [Actinokineospora alba]|uniref:von Willebrand factor type A domain-containing protein n=1 Tax=Actinokineospora alba TaxID=504798 RepID=A0A1H0S637_9PSEU|nr:substrate-binding and VWA domain-containing protein [Actinokineospora alba]TDP66748.1 von Willebrand factor type A domain-containing protein [Actinokineospora alba]SDI50497.1 von Willebrand factor type A domain-containing protein [Actinokineospora alba]SDP37233.1 von Willebrand factor type A domain-containing protein [Actinokineospora alba]
MGRHSPGGGRAATHRSSVVALSLLLVAALVGWLSFDFLRDTLGASDCERVTSLTVAASPDIAPVITQVGRDILEAGDDCYDVRVTSRESSGVAESLAVSDGSEPPDVWIPESTLWLRRAQSNGAWQTPIEGTRIASSPVVLAVTDDLAGQFGWPTTRPTWADLIADTKVLETLGFPDPARDPIGSATLFRLAEPKGNDAAGTTSLLRKLSANTVATSTDLFARLPGTTSPHPPLSAFPSSETAVLRHNVKQTSTKLVASYADPAPPSLDYPFVVLPATTGEKRTVAERFLSRMLGSQARDLLGAAGFRGPAGDVLRDRSQDKRVTADPAPPVPLPEADEVDRVLNEWAGVNLSARIQVLLDVSGSMAEQVPGTGRTRMAVTLDAAELGIRLFKGTTKIGLWVFSTNLDGDKDYRELLPVRPVSDHLAANAIPTVRSIENQTKGATGLYDSTLAAYKSARQNWEPGRINLVVVMTDGKNEDRDGISREQLLAELAGLVDPKRPIAVIGIGIGPDIDIGELQAISAATDGQAFSTPDPSKIAEIFYAALSKLLCQPPACKPTPGS